MGAPIYRNVAAVALMISMPKQTVVDQEITSAVNKKYSSGTKLTVSKKLVDMSKISAHKDRARKALRVHGIPWKQGENGPMHWAFMGRDIEKITHVLQQCRERFFDEAHKLCSEYETVLATELESLGKAFKASDYMSLDEFSNAFKWDTIVVAVEDDAANDLRYVLPKRRLAAESGRVHKKVYNDIAISMEKIVHNIVRDLAGTGSRVHSGDLEAVNIEDAYKPTDLYQRIDTLRDFMVESMSFFESDKLKRMLSDIEHFIVHVRPSNPSTVLEDEDARSRVIAGLRALAGIEAKESPLSMTESFAAGPSR